MDHLSSITPSATPSQTNPLGPTSSSTLPNPPSIQQQAFKATSIFFEFINSPRGPFGRHGITPRGAAKRVAIAEKFDLEQTIRTRIDSSYSKLQTAVHDKVLKDIASRTPAGPSIPIPVKKDLLSSLQSQIAAEKGERQQREQQANESEILASQENTSQFNESLENRIRNINAEDATRTTNKISSEEMMTATNRHMSNQSLEELQQNPNTSLKTAPPQNQTQKETFSSIAPSIVAATPNTNTALGLENDAFGSDVINLTNTSASAAITRSLQQSAATLKTLISPPPTIPTKM